MDTFVVRIWSAGVEWGCNDELRGVVEHVRSGRTQAFAGTNELVALLRHASAPGEVL